MYRPPANNASLMLTHNTKIGSSSDQNTLCLGARSSSQSAFVTAKDLDAAAHINIEPHNYGAQKNTTLVKVPNDASAAAYKEYFHLTENGSMAEGWLLIPDDGDKELVLQKGKVVAGGGSGAWNRLKTAIQTAAAGDTIVIDGIIQATSTPGNNGEIPINRSITIRGKNGNRDTDVLDANKGVLSSNAHRIFKVTNCNLTLEGLTLKGGMATDTSEYDKKLGGGIAVHSATLIIEPGCTIGGDNASQGNTAKTSGGGISVGKKAECTIKEGVTIRHNRVSNGTNIMDGGGGLYIKDTGTQADNGIVTITGTLGNPVRIEDNEARGSIGVGGGIANNGTITLTHVHISGCKAPDSAGLGGGIFVRHGQCTMIDSKVRACVAQEACGGVYVYKDPTVSGLFTMQGNSRIVPSGDDVKGKNDIFLKDNNTPGTTSYINLSGKLTGTRPIGRITVPDGSYSEGTKVLDGNITVGENYKKFTVTPGGYPSQNWYVGSDGKLTTTQPYP